MSSLLFKLSFHGPVHFGSGDGALSLYSSEEHFRADTLFSALCHTAISMGGEAVLEQLISAAASGELRLSDSMPFRGDSLYLPKPCINAENSRELPASLRKAVKKLRWIPVADLAAFSDSVRGGEPYCPSCSAGFGVQQVTTRAAITDGEDSMPYDVGAFRFFDGCGLWFLCLCPDSLEELIQKLVYALGCGGIGGKVSSGYGSFEVEDCVFLDEPFDEQTRWLRDALRAEGAKYLLLSSALPADEELDAVIAGASYQLVRRGGFVRSDSHSAQPMKKDTQFFLAAGSVVETRFDGGLYQVSGSGKHPVYRYSRPVFLGVSL